MQLDDLLNRRELLDSLETEPLVDYLQKHGVLDQEVCSKILSSSESCDRNRQLLYSLINYQRTDEEQDTSKTRDAHENGGTSEDLVAGTNQNNTTVLEYYRDDLINEDLRLSLNAFGLFMNALRHTGYHRLASLLDNERRIHRPTVGSRVSLIGYHARSRRNGQLGIVLQVGAVKISAPEYGLDATTTGGGPVRPCGDWINLADFDAPDPDDPEVRGRAASFPDFRSGLTQTGTALGVELEDDEEEEGSCCLCCFRRRRKRKNRRPRVSSVKVNGHGFELQPLNGKSLASKSMSDDQIIKAYTESASRKQRPDTLTPRLTEEEQRVIQLKANILNEKSEQFYKIVYNADSAAHESLLKYFEQERGVLVLDCFFDDAFVIVAICTKKAKLLALKEDLDNGSFCRDLEGCLLIPEILSAIGVKAMKLAVDFDESEFREALNELS